jgi:hypothetical protein
MSTASAHLFAFSAGRVKNLEAEISKNTCSCRLEDGSGPILGDASCSLARFFSTAYPALEISG